MPAALLGLAVVLASLAAPQARATPATPRSGAAYGSRITFHGWSATSEYVAYTRVRHRPGDGRHAKPIDDAQQLHRRVEAGVFSGFGTMVGGDVATWAAAHGYVADPAPGRRTSPSATEFRAGGREYTLELAVGRKVGWVLRSDDRVIARQTFDSIYLDYVAELFVSPDMKQAALVMHLDAGWVVDAAVYPIKLPPPLATTVRAAAGEDER